MAKEPFPCGSFRKYKSDLLSSSNPEGFCNLEKSLEIPFLIGYRCDTAQLAPIFMARDAKGVPLPLAPTASEPNALNNACSAWCGALSLGSDLDQGRAWQVETSLKARVCYLSEEETMRAPLNFNFTGVAGQAIFSNLNKHQVVLEGQLC